MRLPSVLLVIAASILTYYGAWALWNSIDQQNWMGATHGLLSVAAGLGAAFRRPWSRWLAVLVALSLAASWAYIVWHAFETDVYPMETPLMTALSMLPGSAIVMVGFACVAALFYFFKAARAPKARET